MLVLWPGGVDSDLQSALWRFLHDLGVEWLTFDVVQFAANVVLFIPIGLLVALILPRRWRWLVAPGVLAVSAAIEGVQALLPNRHADLGDVIANTAGGLVGLAIAYVASRKAPRTE